MDPGTRHAQCARALHVKGLVNRLMTDTHRIISWKVERQPPGNLFQAPRHRPPPVLPTSRSACFPCHLIEKIKRKVEGLGKNENGWRITLNAFGDRKAYHGDWPPRATAAMAGIYGNSPAEAIYPLLATDSAGNKPDGSSNRYALTFQWPIPARQGVLVGDDVRR